MSEAFGRPENSDTRANIIKVKTTYQNWLSIVGLALSDPEPNGKNEFTVRNPNPRCKSPRT